MAIDNLISIEFTQQETEKINAALGEIEKVITGKVINLTPEERKQYGRIAKKSENWIRKVKDFMAEYPDLVPRYIDTKEHLKDFNARMVIEPMLTRLTSITERMDDTQKLISSDLYQNSISFYRSLKLAAKENVTGSKTVYNELKTQFPGRPSLMPESPIKADITAN